MRMLSRSTVQDSEACRLPTWEVRISIPSQVDSWQFDMCFIWLCRATMQINQLPVKAIACQSWIKPMTYKIDTWHYPTWHLPVIKWGNEWLGQYSVSVTQWDIVFIGRQSAWVSILILSLSTAVEWWVLRCPSHPLEWWRRSVPLLQTQWFKKQLKIANCRCNVHSLKRQLDRVLTAIEPQMNHRFWDTSC